MSYGFTVCGPTPHQSGEDYWADRSKNKGSRPAGPLWRASAFLVECPYCGAAPFTRCHTFGRPERPSPDCHSGRSWAGHAVIKKMLQASIECQTHQEVSYTDRRDVAKLALDDEPDLPGLMEDDIVALVNRVIDDREKAAAKKAAATRRRPTKRSAA
jgi:hypothetical protein